MEIQKGIQYICKRFLIRCRHKYYSELLLIWIDYNILQNQKRKEVKIVAHKNKII